VTRPDLAIVGGGLLGRCLAWRASLAGARVALYEAGGLQGENSAAWVAAGMIAPATEAIDAEAEITSMGSHSLSLWPQWLTELPAPVFFRDTGTLLLWYPEDAREAVRAQKKIASSQSQMSIKPVDSLRIREVEPALGTRFSEALYIPKEAQVDNRALLKAVSVALVEAGVKCHWDTFIEDGPLPSAGFVVDCRGMGAKRDWAKLRGVRGEILRLHAPAIELDHMLRLLHPHHPVYIVPRPEGRLVVGATCIESEDRSPVSVLGLLELLSSAYSLLPGLAEARILEFNTQLRPALPNNLPALRFDLERKALYINGLYRHGFLLTPTVIEEVLGLLSIKGHPSGRWRCLSQNHTEILTNTQPPNERQRFLSL
jgi:glycine oxidase